jgi:hypothetical protein
MRKFARVTGIIFLLVTVCYTGLALDFADISELGAHTGVNGSISSDLRYGKPGDDINNIETVIKVQGVLFQGTAVPAGNAAGKPVAIAYNPARQDGQRLTLTIGGTAVTAELYDWEMIPIARFVDSGYTACMTLYDKARSVEEERLKRAHDDLMWANFHPALANTLIGLNLFFADAMFVNLDLLQFADEVFDTQIPGYHTPRQNDWSISEIDELLDEESWISYIYTDYGKKISYSIINNRIVFNGAPSYYFVDLCPFCGSVIVLEELNELFAVIHSYIYDINPTVYRTAERTAQWAAFFRMVQADYPQVWRSFIGQIDGIEALPAVETPRYWLKRTARETERK